MPNEVGQTAHHEWEVAQFLYIIHRNCLVSRDMGKTQGRIWPYIQRTISLMPYIPVVREWAEYNMLYGIFSYPTHRLEGNCDPPLTDARLICAPGPFVGPIWRTRLIP